MDIASLYRTFKQAKGICTDTRKIVPGSMFFALKGANFNGNAFVHDALAQGCAVAIADEPPTQPDDRIVVVDSALATLQQLATHHRRQFDIPVIGLTGSNGKTTTKELITAVLNQRFRVHATAGNLNNHIGVPLTLLAMPADTEIAIVEMGANRPDDIRELCDIAEPTNGLITNIGRAHLEGFGGIEGVARAKSQLYEHLKKGNGMVFLHVSDNRLRELSHGLDAFTYATDETQADIWGTLVETELFVRFRWQKADYTSPTIETHMTGGYNLPNFLAAIAIGVYYGVSAASISGAIAAYEPKNNRSQIQRTAKNTLILDAYNANPTSMASALTDFGRLHTEGDKYVILGDMLELGKESESAHRAVIQQLETLNLKGILVGPQFAELLVADPKSGLTGFEEVQKAQQHLKKASLSGMHILIKGSRGIQLEKCVDVL